MAKTFPNLIHVTREMEGTEDEYLNVHMDGALGTEFEATTPAAIYQLVEVGKVVVTRKFESRKNGKKSHR